MSGLFLTIIAVILRIISNPFANVFQKKLTLEKQHPLLINFLTYLCLCVLSLGIALYVTWSPLPVEFWSYSILGGIAGAVGNGFLVRALEKGDLSVLGPINAYKSVVGLIIGFFLLHEVPTLWGLCGTALIILGSYFVLDTTEDKFTWALLKRKEIQYRVWALMLTAIEAVFIKKIILASSVSIAFLSWCWFGALFSFLLLPIFKLKWSKENNQLKSNHLLPYTLLILCIGTMQYTTNFVLQRMPVGYALALFQLSTLVSVFLGYHLFKEQDVRKKLLGSVIMLIGSVLIILL